MSQCAVRGSFKCGVQMLRTAHLGAGRSAEIGGSHGLGSAELVSILLVTCRTSDWPHLAPAAASATPGSICMSLLQASHQ